MVCELMRIVASTLLPENMLPHTAEFKAPYPERYSISKGDSGNGKHIVIRLSLQVCNEPNRAYYQLAHECIHTLCPSGSRNSNNLEDGVACYFSWYYMDQYLGVKNQTPNEDEENYLYAFDLVSPILNSMPSFIRNLRDIQPYLSKVSIDDLRMVNPNLDTNTIHKLLQQFQ